MPDDRGFSVRHDDLLHRWASFSLLRRSVEGPAGPFERTFVDTPGAVGVVALNERREVLLVEQYRAALGSMLLEIPAGMRDVPGEPPLETARRELSEETGFTATSWRPLGSCVGAAAVTNSRVDIFLATDLAEGTRSPHGPEEESMILHLVPLEEAIRLVREGEIVDAKTAIGLLLAWSSTDS